MKIKLHAELIFIRKVSHLARFETEEKENSEMAYWHHETHLVPANTLHLAAIIIIRPFTESSSIRKHCQSPDRCPAVALCSFTDDSLLYFDNLM